MLSWSTWPTAPPGGVKTIPRLRPPCCRSWKACRSCAGCTSASRTLPTTICRIVGELTSLTHLYAWDAARVTDAGVSHLSGLANLQTLHLSYSQIGDESLRVLSKLPRLQELAAPGSRFTDRGLAYLKDATGLEQLSVGNARKITDAGMIHLGRLTNLTSLDLENAEITDHGLEQLTGLAKLKWIFLSGVNASGTEFRKAVPGCSVLR